MVGRPQMYALAVAGALGVAHMLKLLREELELCMALAGCAHITDIDGANIDGSCIFDASMNAAVGSGSWGNHHVADN